MPANIARDAYGYLSVYADELPWHPEVGALVKGAMTAEQVIKRSRQNGGKGLGFTVATVPAFVKVGKRIVEAPDFRGIVREDTGAVFGFASGEYVPIQNIDALRLPEAIAATKKAGFISAGAIGNGAKLFATMDLSRLADVKVPGDPSKHKPFLTVTWAHDALEALRIGFGSRRVECANMRAMQLSEWESGRTLNVRIRHTGDVAAQMDEARRVLGFAEQAIQSHVSLMQKLTEIAIPKPASRFVDAFLAELIPIPQDMERPVARVEARNEIKALFERSKTLVGVKPTAYRLLQAVDEYADNLRPLRAADSAAAAERRMRAILGDGPAVELKDRALALIKAEFFPAPLVAASVN